MILIECSPPFQWRPSYWGNGFVRRWMWGWFAVAYVPLGYNEFVEGLAQGGIELYIKGELKHRPSDKPEP